MAWLMEVTLAGFHPIRWPVLSDHKKRNYRQAVIIISIWMHTSVEHSAFEFDKWFKAICTVILLSQMEGSTREASPGFIGEAAGIFLPSRT